MIYRLAVCDDEKEYRDLINLELQKAAERCGVEITIILFASGEECLSYMEQGNEIDLLFLDIDMPGLNGMETAKQIRKINEKQIFAFLTAHVQYVFESFEVQPFRFIRKPKMHMELFLALQAAVPMIMCRKPKYIFIKDENGEERIDIRDVIYTEILQRKMHFYLKDDRELISKMTMTVLLEELHGDERFVLLDKGLLVNVTYIQRLDKSSVLLENGLMLPVARTRQEKVRESFLRNENDR